MLIRTILLTIACLLSNMTFASPLEVGQKPSTLKLDGDLGGKVTGESWSSEEIEKYGKVISLFYIDPEEKKLNEPLEAAYEAEHFQREKHQSIAIINMAAAWYPNSMIDSQLRKKQEKFPRTVYVKDVKKTLVGEWGLKDDSVNVAIFAKDGKLLYLKKGAMNPDEISELMKLIRANL